MLQEVPGNIAFLLLDCVPLDQSGTRDVALAALGLTLRGTLHPLEIRTATQEDEQTWLALLRGLRARKVQSDPLLICCDGDPAVMGAVRQIFPGAALQISVPHRLEALSRKVEPGAQPAFFTEARRIFQAPDRDAAAARFLAWRNRWSDRAERAAIRDLEAELPLCLAFYRFPANLRRSLRSGSAVNRAVRRSLPAAAPKLNGEFISVRENQVAAEAPVGVSAPPPPEARASAREEQAPRGQVPPPRRRLPYEFWVGVSLAALLAIMGTAELPQLLQSLGSSSSSPPANERQTAPGQEAGNPQNVPQAPTPVRPIPVPSVPAPASTPLPSPPPAPPKPAGAVPLTRGVMVVISATGLSWVRVTADGVKVFENVLRPGDVRRWSANRILQIRSGNAGGVDVTVNGRRLGLLGPVGQIASRAFTRASP